MSKRKTFCIAPDISQGLTDMIQAVNNNSGNFRYEVIALQRIETDPNNPRELSINESDVKNGLNAADKDYAVKKAELDELQSLAHTIKTKGLINPIVVYDAGEKFRIIAGERRFLATILSGKHDIQARVISRKPTESDLRLLQWAENNERKNLSLRERLNNLHAILNAHLKDASEKQISLNLLMNLTGLAKTTSSCYLSLLQAPADVKESIDSNKINSLDKAALIANIDDHSLRIKLLTLAAEGRPLGELKNIISSEKKLNQLNLNLTSTTGRRGRGRAAEYIQLGKIKNPYVIKKLYEIIISHPLYSKYTDRFSEINWNENKKVSEAFQKVLEILSEE